MSKNPQFDYTQFCLEGFIKTFPSLCDSDPEAVALRLYEDASAFSGRNGRSNAGGGQWDIIALVSAASGISIPIPSHEKPREIKSNLCHDLRVAWDRNDHRLIFEKSKSFERSAAGASIDIRDVWWQDPYRVAQGEEEGLEIPETVVDWVEVLCEPSDRMAVIGNHSRNREPRKPVALPVGSLFEVA